jgi:hypothetical protein
MIYFMRDPPYYAFKMQVSREQFQLCLHTVESEETVLRTSLMSGRTIRSKFCSSLFPLDWIQ